MPAARAVTWSALSTAILVINLISLKHQAMAQEEGAFVQCKTLDCSLCLNPKIEELCPKYCHDNCKVTARASFDSESEQKEEEDELLDNELDSDLGSEFLSNDDFGVQENTSTPSKETAITEEKKSIEKLKLVGSEVTKTEILNKTNRPDEPGKHIEKKPNKAKGNKLITAEKAEEALEQCCETETPSCGSTGMCTYNLTVESITKGFTNGCTAPEFLQKVYRCQTRDGPSNVACCSNLPLKCQSFCTPATPLLITQDLYPCLAYFDTIQTCNLNGHTIEKNKKEVVRIDPQEIWNFIFDQGSYWTGLANPARGPQQTPAETVAAQFLNNPFLQARQPQQSPPRPSIFNEIETAAVREEAVEHKKNSELPPPPPGEILNGIWQGLTPLIARNSNNNDNSNNNNNNNNNNNVVPAETEQNIETNQVAQQQQIPNDITGFQGPSLFVPPGLVPVGPVQSYYTPTAQSSAASLLDRILGINQRRSPQRTLAAANPYYIVPQPYFYPPVQTQPNGFGSFLQPVFSGLLGKK